MTKTDAEAIIREYVWKGELLLDEMNPGWAPDIDRHQFNITRCDSCLLGQLYGEFGRGVVKLNIAADAFGFDLSDQFYEDDFDDHWAWQKLQEVWNETLDRKLAVPHPEKELVPA